MAIMLLGTFETITCSSPQSIKSWANHVNGATAIVRLRGIEQLQTKVGNYMFVYLRTQIVIDCLQRRLVVPPTILEWSEVALESGSTEDLLEYDLFRIVAKLCSLRSIEMDQASQTDGKNVIMTLAHSVDADLQGWVEQLPLEYAYSIRTCRSSNAVLSESGQYHVYPNIWTLIIWNTYRSARLLTNEILMKWLPCHSTQTSSFHTMQHRRCEILHAEISSDICASAPYYLGVGNSAGQNPRAAAGSSLIWPLYLTAITDRPPFATRAWVITQLDKIGEIMGIRQATSLANVLKTKYEVTVWDRPKSYAIDAEEDDW
ncbi:hypothetical protein B0A49_05369 [Cryomyces minteri]|uniref:Uncharacterized protein n=1 Tax=Cryomyces minteri TaxID=331657 RepID=A0A4U0X9W4_9PEZI|nr:hypothetical protein B0A49_05369 [Cryomyces minteri]